MEYLQTWLDNSEIPIITAFILGLLTAISPCPLATNITAIGFISKDISNRTRIFANGILYTLGRILAYAILGAVLITILRKGSDMFALQKEISLWGERLLAPAFILIGLFMLFGHKLQLPKWGFSATKKNRKIKRRMGQLAFGSLICHDILSYKRIVLFRHAHYYSLCNQWYFIGHNRGASFREDEVRAIFK